MNKKSNIFIAILLCIGLGIGVAGILLKNFTSRQIETIQPITLSFRHNDQETDISKWLSYSWDGLNFKYPPNWEITKEYYQTPGMLDQGIPPEVVGLDLARKGPQPSIGYISMGGRQVNCGVITNKCLSLLETVYVSSDDKQLEKIFDLFITTITRDASADDIKILNPLHGEKWEAGKTYKIKYELGDSNKNVFINMVDSRKYSKPVVWQACDVLNTGEYEITIPGQPGQQQNPYGPYTISITAPEGYVAGTENFKFYYGESNPFWIVSSSEPFLSSSFPCWPAPQ